MVHEPSNTNLEGARPAHFQNYPWHTDQATNNLKTWLVFVPFLQYPILSSLLCSSLFDYPPSMPVSQPSPTASTCFLDIHKCLLDMGLYLGDRLLWNNVHWVRDGWADRLAIKVTEPKGSEDGKEALPALPSPPPDNGSFDFALISAVVEIDTNDYWLTVDANYHGPSDIWPDYAIIKPSCICQMPDVVPFMADWGDVTDNLHWLQEDVATPTFKAKQGLFTMARATGPRFKMHHVLFEVCFIFHFICSQSSW